MKNIFLHLDETFIGSLTLDSVRGHETVMFQYDPSYLETPRPMLDPALVQVRGPQFPTNGAGSAVSPISRRTDGDESSFEGVRSVRFWKAITFSGFAISRDRALFVSKRNETAHSSPPTSGMPRRRGPRSASLKIPHVILMPTKRTMKNVGSKICFFRGRPSVVHDQRPT